MPLYSVNQGTDGGSWDLMQLIQALSATNDIGAITPFAPINPPGAPSVAVNTAAGNLTGNYQYAVAFVTGYIQGQSVAQGGTLYTQGNTGGGTASATVSPSAQQVNLSNIPTGPTGTVARIIYRTKTGGSSFFVLVQLNDNTTTTYTDNIADANLGVAMPTSNTTGSYFAGAATGITNLTASGSVNFNGGMLTMGNGTSNTIVFNSQGANAPSVDPNGHLNSTGTKLNLFNSGAFGIGVENGAQWYSSYGTHKWYTQGLSSTAVPTVAMTLDGSGNLTPNGSLTLTSVQSGASSLDSPSATLQAWNGTAAVGAFIKGWHNDGLYVNGIKNNVTLLTLDGSGDLTIGDGSSVNYVAPNGATQNFQFRPASGQKVGFTNTGATKWGLVVTDGNTPSTETANNTLDDGTGKQTISGLATFSAGITGTGSIGSLTVPWGNLTSVPTDLAKTDVSQTFTAELTINQGATNSPALTLTSNSGGWGSGMYFTNTGATGKTYGIYSGSEGDFHFGLSTADILVLNGGTFAVTTKNNTLDDGSGKQTIASLATFSSGITGTGTVGSLTVPWTNLTSVPTDLAKTDATTKQVFSGPNRFTGDVDLPNVNMSASSADANGNYTVTTYTRPGGNKFMVSTLSGTVDSNGNYPTMTNVYYATDGTTVDHTDTWTLTWDANSKLSASSVVRS